jgi:hypothetical protein
LERSVITWRALLRRLYALDWLASGRQSRGVTIIRSGAAARAGKRGINLEEMPRASRGFL